MFSSWQISRKTIKRFRVFGIITAIALFIFYLPVLIFQIELGRRGGAKYLSQELTKVLGASVEVGEVSIDYLGSIQTKGIDIKDSLGANILKAKELRFDLSSSSVWQLLTKNELSLSYIRLYEPHLTLTRDSLNRLNISPILEHLQSPDQTSQSDFELFISGILLREASFEYRLMDSLLFGAKHINAKFDELRLSAEEGNHINILNLGFTLSNGFCLNSLSTVVNQSRDSLRIDDLDLHFASSKLSIPKLYLANNRLFWGKVDELDLDKFDILIKDLSPFFAELKQFDSEHFRGQIKLKGQAQDNQLSLEYIRLNITKLATISAKGLVELSSWGTFANLKLDHLKVLLKNKMWHRLGDFVDREEYHLNDLALLGRCLFEGSASWQREDMALSGQLKTGLGGGEVETRLKRKDEDLHSIMAKFKLRDIALAKYGDNTLDLIVPKLNLSFLAERDDKLDPYRLETSVLVPNLDFRGLHYDNFELFGSGKGKYLFDFLLDDNSLRAKAKLSFEAVQKLVSNIKLDYQVANLSLTDWGLHLGKANRRYSSEGSLECSDLNEPLKHLSLAMKYFAWRDMGRKPINGLDNLKLSVDKFAKGSLIKFKAPWLDGELRSNLPFQDLTQKFRKHFYAQMPIIAHWGESQSLGQEQALATARLDLDSIPNAINEFFELPLRSGRSMMLRGAFDEQEDNLQLLVKAEEAYWHQYKIADAKFICDKEDIELRGDFFLDRMGDFLGADLELSRNKNNVALNLDLGLNKDKQENGVISSQIQISSPRDLPQSIQDLNMLVGLGKSKLRIHNEAWQLSPAEIFVGKGRSYIKGLKLESQDKSLMIEGAIGDNPQDSLHLKLKNLSLVYILASANVNFKLLETHLSGDLYAKKKEGAIYAFGDVQSKEFFVDSYDVGASKLHLAWDSKDNFLAINGVLGAYPTAYVKANGGISLKSPSGIDIMFSAEHLNVGFVQAFTAGFLSNLEGEATGDVRLFGVFKDGVTIEGEADLKQAKVGVKSIGTTYTFDDKLRFTVDKMIFPNIKLRDERGHTAIFDGLISHHNFKDMNIDLRFEDLENFKVLENRNARKLPILGKVYCSGSGSLRGTNGNMLLSMDASVVKPSNISIDINALNKVWQDQSLMRFTNLRDSIPSDEQDILAEAEASSQNIFDMKLILDIKPQTEIGIRIANDRSDEVKAKGEGRLKVDVPYIGEPTIEGDFNFLSGDYSLNLESLMNKRFKIRRGSHIKFQGNPILADIDIDAIYRLTANIADLDEGLAYGTKRTNMPVECILNLKGTLARPKIDFGIALPKASSDVEQRVRSLLSTEEAMTRQSLALISIGKFMPSEYSNATEDGTSNWTALASSAISEQLSSMLGSLSEQFQLGASIKTRNEYFMDTDIELLFSGKLLNNRLIISGNVGYHDNPFLSNTYIGEFDLEYILNRSRSLRLKGFNHYNNTYQYITKGLTTQGFGVLYRKRFDTLSELFNTKKKKKSKEAK